MAQATPGNRNSPGKRRSPDSPIDLAHVGGGALLNAQTARPAHAARRPRTLSCSMEVSMAKGRAAPKQASTSARRVGWLASTASRSSAPASLMADAMVAFVAMASMETRVQPSPSFSASRDLGQQPAPRALPTRLRGQVQRECRDPAPARTPCPHRRTRHHRREDLSRLRSGVGPQNKATVRHMAMNLLRGP